MSNSILQDIPVKERRDKLKEMAKKVEFRQNYQRPLTQAELDNENRVHSKEAIEKERLEDELKSINDQYKARIKAQDAKISACLGRVKSEKQDVEGDLFGMVDYDLNRIEYYDVYGVWIYGRELMPSEAQGALFTQPEMEGEETTPLDVANQVMKEAGAKVNLLDFIHELTTDTYDTPARFEGRAKQLEEAGLQQDDDFTMFAYINNEGNPVTAPERGLYIDNDLIHNLTDADFDRALASIKESVHQYRIDMAGIDTKNGTEFRGDDEQPESQLELMNKNAKKNTRKK